MATQYDCIVVGSGPLGALSARRLAEKGLNVAILEAGEPTSTPPGEHVRNQQPYQTNPGSFIQEAFARCEFFNEKASIQGLPGANITTTYGGQGIIWTNNCPRPTPYFSEWPVFNKQKWDSRLEEAEKILRVQTNLFDQSIRQEKIYNYLHHHLKLNMPERQVEKLPVAVEMNAQNQLRYTATYEILSLSTEISSRIHIRCKTKALELIAEKNRIIAVKVLDENNHIIELTAKYFLIAGGIFGTTQLLFDSHIRPYALGRYMHFHPLILAQIVLKPEFCASMDINDLPPKLYIPPSASYPWHSMILRDIYMETSQDNVHPNQLLELQFFAPVEAREENQMIMSNGVPRFNVELSTKDQKTLDAMRKDLFLFANLLGDFRKGGEPTTTPFGFTHPMGTCRMGNDPAISVADYQSRVYGYKNLFLATVGLIPIPIAINPTLTAAAIAIEATDTIAMEIVTPNSSF